MGPLLNPRKDRIQIPRHTTRSCFEHPFEELNVSSGLAGDAGGEVSRCGNDGRIRLIGHRSRTLALFSG